MNIDQFKRTLAAKELPAGLSPLLEALWHDAQGDWARAHRVVQDVKGKDACAVHAYLHRKEGDLANADYWYQRANKTRPSSPLADEWAALVEQHIAAG